MRAKLFTIPTDADAGDVVVLCERHVHARIGRAHQLAIGEDLQQLSRDEAAVEDCADVDDRCGNGRAA